MQSELRRLNERITENDLNYEEVTLLLQSNVKTISSMLNTPIEHSLLDDRSMKFCKVFEQLNLLIIRYIPRKPELEWCTLQSVLTGSGVSLPDELESTLEECISTPDNVSCRREKFLENEPPSNITNEFSPPCEVCLKLSRRVTLRSLIALVDELKKFLEPINNHLSMILYFHLKESELFEKYKEHYLRRYLDSHQLPLTSACEDDGFQSEEEDDDDEENEVDIKILALSLDETRKLLLNICEGNAEYNEITANGKIDLALDIESEICVLREFILYTNFASKDELSSVQCMLELIQYAETHIPCIENVCRQYKLDGCLKDDDFINLLCISSTVKVEKQNLTLNAAKDYLKEAKVLLFGKSTPHKTCLDLFSAISDSAPFHQFIQQKQFIGEKGLILFTQQYELITAQLQHESYNEQVLNNLFAAFKFMSPFMDATQTLRSLMDQIILLDTSKGLEQLKTVTSNINLIQLWFSRAEVIVMHVSFQHYF